MKDQDMARVLLSLFTNEQIAMIYRTCRNNSFESLALSDTERVRESMPPAIMGFLSGNGYSSDQDAKELAWGFATLQYGLLGEPKDATFWSNVYQKAFGLSETYSDKIGEAIETDDKIPGMLNKALDFLRRSYNWIVPEAIEIQQSDKFDVDGMWEMQLAGRQTIELAKRAYSGLSTVKNGVLSGTIFDMLSRAETGDIEEGDVDAESYLELAGDLYSAHNRMAMASKPETGLVAPLLAMAGKELIKRASGNAAVKTIASNMRRSGSLAAKLTNNPLTAGLRSRPFGSTAGPNARVAAPYGTGQHLASPVANANALRSAALDTLAPDDDDEDDDGGADYGDVAGYDPIPRDQM